MTLVIFNNLNLNYSNLKGSVTEEFYTQWADLVIDSVGDVYGTDPSNCLVSKWNGKIFGWLNVIWRKGNSLTTIAGWGGCGSLDGAIGSAYLNFGLNKIAIHPTTGDIWVSYELSPEIVQIQLAGIGR